MQGLMRLVWFHVPLRLTPKTADELAKPNAPSRGQEEMEAVMAEKRMALDLLEGYRTATSCERPITAHYSARLGLLSR